MELGHQLICFSSMFLDLHHLAATRTIIFKTLFMTNVYVFIKHLKGQKWRLDKQMNDFFSNFEILWSINGVFFYIGLWPLRPPPTPIERKLRRGGGGILIPNPCGAFLILTKPNPKQELELWKKKTKPFYSIFKWGEGMGL